MKHLLTIPLCFLALSLSVNGQGACNNQSSVTYQGYDYDIVEIGDQCWFAENLRSHLYLNGDSINYITSPEEWVNTLAGAVTEMQTYNPCGNVYDPSVCTIEGYYFETYGRLYNGYAIEDPRPLCPNNWRVPTDSDFVSMQIHLGMTEVEATSFGMHGTIGSELKASTLWFNGSNGTDLHGFKGLPGGYIDASGGNQNAGSTGHWWTQTPHNASIITRALYGPSDGVYRDAGHKWLGYSIRCINEVFDYGCTNEQACNYDSTAIVDDGSCEYLSCTGCTTPFACNYDTEATIDDGSCIFICEGCTDEVACNYDPSANVEDSSCEYLSCTGCTDAAACNFNPESKINDGSCLYPEQYYNCFGGCINDIDSDGICDELEILGCTDESSCNFDIEATDEDGSCEYETCAGCQYEFACNYDPDATIADNESCEYGTCPGCTDSTACNYNPTVSEDDGSCIYTEEGYTCDGTCINDSDGDGICDSLCSEDLNGDGVIGVQDLLLVLSEFGCASSCENDINQDGYVAVQDILLLLSEFGNTCEISGFQNCGDDIGHEGYAYNTVLIGDQCWFSENCRYLPEVSPSSDPFDPSTSDPYYFVYGYEGIDVTAAQATSNYETYGVLYNWPAIMTEGICPSGWHIPSDEEWQTMEMELGMSEADASSYGARGSPVGDYLKSTSGWNSNGNGSNSSGFNGLPGGGINGFFLNEDGDIGQWASATESGSNLLRRVLYYNNDYVGREFSGGNGIGYSARCVRD